MGPPDGMCGGQCQLVCRVRPAENRGPRQPAPGGPPKPRAPGRDLRHALRTAPPSAAGRISLELESVASELREATRISEELQAEMRPYRTTRKLVQDLVDQMTGLVEHAPIETRVAWVRDLFERIDVDGTEQRAIAAWKAPTGQVDRLESVTEWLRR